VYRNLKSAGINNKCILANNPYTKVRWCRNSFRILTILKIIIKEN